MKPVNLSAASFPLNADPKCVELYRANVVPGCDCEYCSRTSDQNGCDLAWVAWDPLEKNILAQLGPKPLGAAGWWGLHSKHGRRWMLPSDHKCQRLLASHETAKVVSAATGHNCTKCNEYNEYAAANQPNGTYICYRCR